MLPEHVIGRDDCSVWGPNLSFVAIGLRSGKCGAVVRWRRQSCGIVAQADVALKADEPETAELVRYASEPREFGAAADRLRANVSWMRVRMRVPAGRGRSAILHSPPWGRSG